MGLSGLAGFQGNPEQKGGEDWTELMEQLPSPVCPQNILFEQNGPDLTKKNKKAQNHLVDLGFSSLVELFSWANNCGPLSLLFQ